MEENTLNKRDMGNDAHLSNVSSVVLYQIPHYCGILNVQNTSWNVQDWDGIGIYQQFHIKCSESQLQRGSGRFLCLENGTWKSDLICLDLPRDCESLVEHGETNSGVYEIYPFGSRARSARVFCDMYTMEGGWTAIQKRVNGAVRFDRTWNEYRKGFGDAGQDFWIGNDVIHQLTKGKISSLYISITLVNGSKLYELYEQFSVSNEADNYQLFLAGTASGTLGDSMMHTVTSAGDLSGMKFTTSDRDNDQWIEGNCAVNYKGGWWFNNCYRAFLNGAWKPDSWRSPWYPTVKYGEYIKETLMMIRSL
ncbi:fibroleukin-like [Saccostrea cucullata]|uniref:fibroleukin-like n=1 Tax=Saccostrea cuccullata TaxID=36930 RepID=UPI002ED197E0